MEETGGEKTLFTWDSLESSESTECSAYFLFLFRNGATLGPKTRSTDRGGWVYQWSGPAGPRRYGPCAGARVEPAEPAGPRQYGEPAGPRGPAEPASPQSPQGPQGLIYFVQLRSKYFVEIQRVVGRRLRTTTLYCSMLLQNTTAY